MRPSDAETLRCVIVRVKNIGDSAFSSNIIEHEYLCRDLAEELLSPRDLDSHDQPSFMNPGYSVFAKPLIERGIRNCRCLTSTGSDDLWQAKYKPWTKYEGRRMAIQKFVTAYCK